MRVQIQEGLGVLGNVLEFLTATEVTTDFGPVKQHAEGVAASLARLKTKAAAQDFANRSVVAGTLKVHDLAERLRTGFLRPVSRMAKRLFPNDPAIRHSLKMPSTRNYSGIIAAGTAMAELATVHKEKFVTAGFGDVFVERVQQAVTQLDRALLDRGVHKSNRSATTAGMLDEMAKARDNIRLIDSLLVHEWSGDKERLAKWRSVSRFIRRKPSEEVATIPVAVPPVAAPAAVTPAVPVVAPSSSPPMQPVVGQEVRPNAA